MARPKLSVRCRRTCTLHTLRRVKKKAQPFNRRLESARCTCDSVNGRRFIGRPRLHASHSVSLHRYYIRLACYSRTAWARSRAWLACHGCRVKEKFLVLFQIPPWLWFFAIRNRRVCWGCIALMINWNSLRKCSATILADFSPEISSYGN